MVVDERVKQRPLALEGVAAGHGRTVLTQRRGLLPIAEELFHYPNVVFEPAEAREPARLAVDAVAAVADGVRADDRAAARHRLKRGQEEALALLRQPNEDL